jgi:hypothetical protein
VNSKSVLKQYPQGNIGLGRFWLRKMKIEKQKTGGLETTSFGKAHAFSQLLNLFDF